VELLRAKYWQNVKLQTWAALATVVCGLLAVYNWMRTWEFAHGAAKLWRSIVLPVYIARNNTTFTDGIVRFVYTSSAIVLVLIWLVFVLYAQYYFVKALKHKRYLSSFAMVLGIQCLLQAVVVLGRAICDYYVTSISYGSAIPIAEAVIIETAIFAVLGIAGMVGWFLIRNASAKKVAEAAVSHT